MPFSKLETVSFPFSALIFNQSSLVIVPFSNKTSSTAARADPAVRATASPIIATVATKRLCVILWAPPVDGCLAGYGKGITISRRLGYRRRKSGMIEPRGGGREG